MNQDRLDKQFQLWMSTANLTRKLWGTRTDYQGEPGQKRPWKVWVWYLEGLREGRL